jgi:hypothetical protein
MRRRPRTLRHPASSTLECIRLSPTDWRISEVSPVNGEPSRILGFIERYAKGRFEILWMSDPVRWAYVGTFDEALAAFDDSVRFTRSVFAERQIDQSPPRPGPLTDSLAADRPRRRANGA